MKKYNLYYKIRYTVIKTQQIILFIIDHIITLRFCKQIIFDINLFFTENDIYVNKFFINLHNKRK